MFLNPTIKIQKLYKKKKREKQDRNDESSLLFLTRIYEQNRKKRWKLIGLS